MVGGEVNSSLKPNDRVNRGAMRITSETYQAPKSERQFISVGAGSHRKLEADPWRKFERLENVNWPY